MISPLLLYRTVCSGLVDLQNAGGRSSGQYPPKSAPALMISLWELQATLSFFTELRHVPIGNTLNLLHPLPALCRHRRTAQIPPQSYLSESTDHLVILVPRPHQYQPFPNLPSVASNVPQNLRIVPLDEAVPIQTQGSISSAQTGVALTGRGGYNVASHSNAVPERTKGTTMAVDSLASCVWCKWHCQSWSDLLLCVGMGACFYLITVSAPKPSSWRLARSVQPRMTLRRQRPTWY